MIARILLIDGDDATRTRYAEFLRSVGFDVTAVSWARRSESDPLAARKVIHLRA